MLDGAYHISREAILNATRHSRANKISVEIVYKKSHLSVTVLDDGSGIDQGTIESGKDGHWGLSMMRERAEEVGGKLTISNRNVGGAEVVFSVPGHLAYAAPKNGEGRAI